MANTITVDRTQYKSQVEVRSSNIDTLYWAGASANYPLIIKFLNGQEYAYKVQDITLPDDNLPIGNRAGQLVWFPLLEGARQKDKAGSVGSAFHQLIRGKCEYAKVL